MKGTPRISTILAATALLAAAAVLVVVVGMNRGAPSGDVAHASDPASKPADRAAAEAEARDAAKTAWASRSELGLRWWR